MTQGIETGTGETLCGSIRKDESPVGASRCARKMAANHLIEGSE